MPGQLYWPPENIGYALSVTDRKSRSEAAFWSRALSLAELLDAIVFSTEIVTDLGNDPIDEQVSALSTAFNLVEVIRPVPGIDAPLSAHSTLFPPGFDVADDEVLNWAANLKKEDIEKN